MRVLLIFFFTLLCISTYVHNAPTWPTMVSTIVPIRPCRVYLGVRAGRLPGIPKTTTTVSRVTRHRELLPSTIRDLLHWVYLARGGSQYLTTGRRLNTSSQGPFANYVAENADVIGTETGDTLWMSVLLSKLTNDDQEMWVDLHDNNISWCSGCSGQHVAVGYFETIRMSMVSDVGP